MKRLIFFALAIFLLTGCGSARSSSGSSGILADAEMYSSYQDSKYDDKAKAEATRITLEKLLECGGDENISTEQYQACVQRAKGQSPSTTQLSTSCISWTDAAKYVGRNICVSGVVYRTYADSESTAFFIDFDNSRSSFYGVSFKWRWNSLNGQCVEIYGPISTYNGRSQIIIERTDQVRSCRK